MRMTKEAQKGKGLLGFGGGVQWGGTGVNYATAPQGAQTYNASALVAR
jgi:hypothetical protein